MATTNNNELVPISYDLPYAVDVTLYKYNYYDNLIISALRKHTQSEPIPNKGGFIVTTEDFIYILNNFFTDELNNAHSLTEITIKDGVNSIYFLDKIINNFHNLEYIKVNVSKTREFSRLLQVTNERQVINFEYRILTSVIRLTDYFTTEDELNNVNAFLKEINLLKADEFRRRKSYVHISAQDFMSLINNIEEVFFEDETFEEQYMGTLDILYSLIDQKCETDNSRLIIITDYPD